jgi:hypothetical protein
MRRSQRNGLATLAMLTAVLGCAGGGGLGSVEGLLAGSGLSGSGALTDGTIASGLRQALEVGTRNAVSRTSGEDGFFGNPLIRIAMPESLDKMATGLRAIGFGSQVDELELAMNRAAEQAAGEATDVFWSAIKQMTFADVRAIWQGDATAATDFFERTTRDELYGRFQPIVDEKMGQVGLARLYDDLSARYTALPFTSEPPVDMRSYVTDRALDGLFTVLGEEEQKIREDPGARTTDLLRKVFG